MNNKETVKRYFKKYFKEQYFTENDLEFKSLVRILNKKDKEVKNLNEETVKLREGCSHCKGQSFTMLAICSNCGMKIPKRKQSSEA